METAESKILHYIAEIIRQTHHTTERTLDKVCDSKCMHTSIPPKYCRDANSLAVLIQTQLRKNSILKRSLLSFKQWMTSCHLPRSVELNSTENDWRSSHFTKIAKKILKRSQQGVTRTHHSIPTSTVHTLVNKG